MTPLGLYKIKTIANLAGLNPTLLRAWERRYGILEPVRTPTGHRLYTADDLKLLQRVKGMITEGRSIGEIVMLGRVQLLRSGSLAGPRQLAVSELAGGSPEPVSQDAEFARQGQSLLKAATELDERALQAALDRVFGAVSACTAIQEVMIPAAREIGNMWAEGTASVAAEHLLSSVFGRRIHKLIEVEATTTGTAGEGLCACFPDEQHKLGALIVAYVLLRLGASVTFLGPALPLEDLEQSCLVRRPSFVFLSVSRSQLLEAHRARLLELVGRFPTIRFVVGGAGVVPDQEPELLSAGAVLWPAERPLRELRTLLV